MHERLRKLTILISLLLPVGCGGAAIGRGTVPDHEQPSIALLPHDAFFVARMDLAAVRAVPGWNAIEATLAATEPDTYRSWLTVDTVHIAVGGLVDVVMPRDALTILDGDATEVGLSPTTDVPGDTANDQPVTEPDRSEPAHVGLARMLGGKLPVFVMTMEGSDVSGCLRLVEGAAVREVAGYRVATKDGLAVALKGTRLCVATFEPTLEHVLTGRGGNPRIVERLRASGENGDAGLVGFAFELGTPAFRALSEAFSPDGDAEEEVIAPHYLALVERVFSVITDDIEAVEWQLGRSGGSFASRTRVHASDADRGVMWRELTELYLGIVAAVAESGVAGMQVSHVLDTVTSSTRLETQDDGFVLITRVSDEHVTSFVDGLVSSAEESEEDETFVSEREDSDRFFFEAPDLAARERIAALEPQIDERLGRAGYARVMFVESLATAYAHVGRFDDAKALLSRTIGMLDAENGTWMVAVLAEMDIATGYGPTALIVLDAQIAACEQGDCESTSYLRAMRAVVEAGAGEASSLASFDAALDPYLEDESTSYASMRARILFMLGRYGEAAAVLETLCTVSRNDACAPAEPRAMLVESLVRTGQSIERIEDLITRFFVAPDATGAAHDEVSTRASLRCLVHAQRAPFTDIARETCRVAAELASAEHGPTHPDTAATLLEYARTLAAARDAAGARRELARVDAALATLGPSHPLRARRVAFGARTR